MIKRECKQCGQEFTLTDSEMKFYNEKGLNLPKRCSECRNKNKNINNNEKDNIKDLENNIDIEQYKIKKVERFWNEIFMEHAMFIRGMLDPSEEKLINSADKFAKKFKELMKKTSDINEATSTTIVSDTLIETAKLIDFKKAATKGILGCEIKSIILPLLSDHVLREANHYLRILEAYEE